MVKINQSNEKLIGKLLNWKFDSAQKYLEGESADVQLLVKALASNFGDCGWFEGNMAVIISNALENIGVCFEE